MSEIVKARGVLKTALDLAQSNERASHMVCECIKLALSKMTRAKHVTQAPKQSRPLTKAMAKDIRAYSKRHPRMLQQTIANDFGVGIGRVSEALNHKR